MKTLTLVRLAVVNTAGFSASTIMPLWLGGIAGHFGMPPWFAGLAVFTQLGGAALFNLITPLMFARFAALPLARSALAVAAVACMLPLVASPASFILSSLVCGCALGTLLHVTNRLMGSDEHVQQGYAIFVLIEVCVATLMFLGGAALIGRLGLLAVFPEISFIALVALLLLVRLPIKPSLSASVRESGPPAHRGFAVLGLVSFGLFFIGQATLNSFMPTIGKAAGLDMQAASRTIGLGMPFGFLGAMLARWVGERVKPIVPVTLVVAALAVIAPMVTAAPGLHIFVLAVVTLAGCTMFSVPYFFAQLGTLGRDGRYTAYGPAMMLSGLAFGPSAAVLLDESLGLPAVGVFSAALLLSSVLAFAVSARSAVRARTDDRGE